MPPGGKSLGVEEEEGYGISKEYVKKLIGAKDIVLEEATISKNRENKSATFGEDAWGTVMISASGPNEKSWESDELKQSIFTYYFLEGLNRSEGSVKNAFFMRNQE